MPHISAYTHRLFNVGYLGYLAFVASQLKEEAKAKFEVILEILMYF